MKIIIDADACPKNALDICLRLGKAWGVEVWTVASFNHRITREHHITVGNSPQETDIRLVNLAEPGDIAVTQDWGLAAMLLAKTVSCLNPDGHEYSLDNIDFLLAERDLKARFRRSGGRTKGPKKRTPEHDRRFQSALERYLEKLTK